MGGKRRPAQSFVAGRVEGLRMGAKQRKYKKWQAIKNPQAAGVAKKGKKMSLKNRKQAEKRAQTKNYGRGKK